MLAISRSTRVATRLSLHTRVLSAAAQNAGSSNAAATTECPESSTTDSTAKGQQQRRTRRADASVDCMYVYPWNGIRSSAEGLAIARAVEDKYGPAKEVIFPRDASCVNIFQPYFWLVFDNPDVRKCFTEKSAQFNVQVADLPRGDGNVGVEEMMRGLGLSEDKNIAGLPESSPTPSEAGASKDVSDVLPGYKTLDVRVEWAFRGPPEVFKRKIPVLAFPVQEKMLPHFATAWLAFDGFSPESARGPHTPNLLRAREKWQKLAPTTSSSSSARSGNDDLANTAPVPPSQEPIDAGTGLESEPGSASEAQTKEENVPRPREWVPIIPGGGQRPAPARTSILKGASASTPLNPTRIAESVDPHITDDNRAMFATPSAATHSAENTSEAVAAASSETVGHTKMSRRERILHLARQNARTPLPKPVEEPQPPPAPTEAEMADEAERERHVKERTIRERLWRLVGGNF